MKSTGRHPSRSAMLEAAATGTVTFKAHLERCEDCRILLQLLSSHQVAGKPQLARTPMRALRQQAAIARLQQSRSPARTATGLIKFDSWRRIASTQLRDEMVGLERRLDLHAKGVTLKLVAERQSDGWDFVARVYRGNKVTTDFIVQVGRRKLVPLSRGFYNWSSTRPPSIIRLLSPSLRVDFGRLSWSPAINS